MNTSTAISSTPQESPHATSKPIDIPSRKREPEWPAPIAGTSKQKEMMAKQVAMTCGEICVGVKHFKDCNRIHSTELHMVHMAAEEDLLFGLMADMDSVPVGQCIGVRVKKAKDLWRYGQKGFSWEYELSEATRKEEEEVGVVGEREMSRDEMMATQDGYLRSIRKACYPHVPMPKVKILGS